MPPIFLSIFRILIVHKLPQLLLNVLMEVVVGKFFGVQMDGTQWGDYDGKYDTAHTRIQKYTLQTGLDVEINKDA